MAPGKERRVHQRCCICLLLVLDILDCLAPSERSDAADDELGSCHVWWCLHSQHCDVRGEGQERVRWTCNAG